MGKVRRDIYREPVHGDPTPDPHPDSTDLGFAAVDILRPDANPAFRPPAIDTQVRERSNHPPFNRMHEAADIAPPLLEVEHQVTDPLARPMISVSPTTSGLDHLEARIEQLRAVSARTCGVNRGMFQKPYQLALVALRNRMVSRNHTLQRRAIGYLPYFLAPFDIFGEFSRHRRLRGDCLHAYQEGTQWEAL